MRISDWSSDVCSSDLLHGGRRAKDRGRKYRDDETDQQQADDEPRDPEARAIDRRPDRDKIKRKYRILAIIAIAVARPHRLRDTAVILAHVNISIHVRVIVVHININDRDGRRPCSTTATVAGSPGTAPWQNY